MTLLNITYRSVLFFSVLLVLAPAGKVQAAPQAGQSSPPATQNPTTTTPSTDVETQKIEAPPGSQTPPATLTNDMGSLHDTEVKALLTKVRFSEYRINDLLTDVRPERWKLPDTTLESFHQTLKALRAQVAALEEWRAQFEQRTDSLYLGFQTYAAINSALPRLNGVAKSVAEHETAGYAAQFSKAGDQLFDLQQTIGSYVGSLLQNRDQLIVNYEHNMATCQQDLSAAMRGKGSRATPMRNAQPIRPQRRSAHPSSVKPGGSENQPKQENKPKDKTAAPPTK